MEKVKTTIIVPKVLMDRINTFCKNEDCTLTEFFTYASINHLEKMGDFDVRDLVEGEVEDD